MSCADDGKSAMLIDLLANTTVPYTSIIIIYKANGLRLPTALYMG